MLTNDPDGSGSCVAIEDYRTVTVVPPSSFTGCLQLADWTQDGSNSDGIIDDSEEPCLVTVVGSNNLSGSPGTTDMTHCTGAGSVSFDWTFLAPANKIVWHQEDQTVGSNTSSTNLRVNRPTNVSTGDLIIVTIHVNGNTTINTPTGFTAVAANANSRNTNVRVASFWKIATGSEPTTYNFTTSGTNLGSNDRIYASRVTGHDPSNPIGGSNGTTQYFPYVSNENGYRSISVPGFATAANSMLVAALAVDINGASVLEFTNAPIGMTTMYYNDTETSSRAATAIVSGNTGTRSFQWPSYGSRNRDAMYAAAQMFTINPATNEEDAGYFLLNGTPTLLSKTNGATGSRTVAVNSSDEFGFRVGTSTNTGGPGKLIIYNLTMPNDIPVLSGLDTVFVAECQVDGFVPVFEDPVATDDCDSAVVAPDYPVTDTIIADGCSRSQKRTWVYVDECGAESLPFEQVAVWSVLEPITLSCPVDPILEACTSEDTVTARYNKWVDGFTAEGGCDLITNLYAVPPLILSNIACGDTLHFTFIVSDECGQVDSCTSTFTVKPVDTLVVFCPVDTVLAGCSHPDSIIAAYDAWKAGFYYDGGCASVIDNMDEFPALPDLTCGGQIEFVYSVSNSCGQFESCISTFTVEPPEALIVAVPTGVSLPLCSKATDIETAYNDWKAQFSYTGGCNVITNIDSIPDLGDITCGGTISFTYTAKNGNSSCEDLQEGTSSFTVAEAPDLIVSCPADTTIEGCLGIQAITDAYDTWVDGFRASGGCNVTTNIDSIPPLGDMVCNGSITFTFIVGNDSTLCSDHVECTSTFTIGAAPLLEVITPADTTIQGCNTSQDVIDAFNAWKARFDYTGGCNVSTSDLSVYDLPSSCGGTVTVVYTAWDNCSQAVTDSAKFTLNPEYIVINAPLDDIQPACQTQVDVDTAFAQWKAKFGFTGGCGTIGTDLSAIEAPNACGGTIVVNYSAQDVCGQVVNSSAVFTIDAPGDVLQEPSFNNPADITIYRNDSCNYNADPAITGSPTNLTDNCTDAGDLTMSYNDSIAAGSCTSEILIYRTWIVMDNCMNATSEVQLITVQDSTPPVVKCAWDVDGVADNGECDASSIDIGTTTASDNCVLASLQGIRSDGLQITDPYPVGVTTITWTATDGCGNSASCVQTISLIDGVTQPPTIDCPEDVEQNAGPNNCYLEDVVIPDPTADDNCEVATITWEMTGATIGTSPSEGFNYVGGETFNVGVTTVIYTAADSAGNTASCSFKVIIHDVTPPQITANCEDVSDYADPGRCWKVPATLNDPDYYDTCWDKDSLKVRWEMTGATTGAGDGFVTDSAFNVGVTHVKYYITDPDNNEATCEFDVTILDVTPPEITANCGDVADDADPNSCWQVPATLQDPVFRDDCWDVDSLTVRWEMTGATVGSGYGFVTDSSFHVGVTHVTYYVSDPDNNEANCSFDVTIHDVTLPEITANCFDVTDNADPNSCWRTPVTLHDPQYEDNCWDTDSLTVRWEMTGATVGSGSGFVTDSSFHVGVTHVTYYVSDPDGNEANCEFDVTIVDVTPPDIDISGCQNVTDTTDANNCAVIPPAIQDPVYNDDCWDVDSLTLVWQMTGATTGNGSGSVKGETFNVGVTTVKYIVSDPDGNKDSCSFTVTILPYDMPAFTTVCPPDVVADNDPTVCGADLIIPVPSVDDPCNLGYVVTNDRTGTDNASGYYPVDTTYVVWTITPTIGSATSCTQMVIVKDVEDPIIVTCPVDQNFEGCDSTSTSISPVFSGTLATSSYAEFSDAGNQGEATDNCAIVTVTYIDVASGTCPMVITRTWTVYDAAGNSASCDQTITIGETEAPLVDCPSDFETPSVFDSVYALVTIPVFDFSDNCTDSVDIKIEWTITGATTGSGTGLIPSPYRFNQGVSTINYTFTDNCGNQTPCSFDINVLYPPEITCLPPDTLQMDPGVCYNHIEAGDIDNPGVPSNTTGEVLEWTWTVYDPDGVEIATGTSTGVSPAQIGPVDFPKGTSTIHWYAQNLSGHDECDQLVTVVDEEPPTFTANPYEDCVEPLFHAIYTGDADNLDYDPDYPDADYDILYPGDTGLDIDLATYADNCCVLSDGYALRWEIDFEGNNPAEPNISGYSQPSTYVDPNSGLASIIKLWGDGTNFQSRTHTITYWITDCNGNESDGIQTTITINPRPELIKMN
ncbi:MAG: HYR domain-containing protein [Draconibacterium sp.]